jgi:hypothetical protein
MIKHRMMLAPVDDEGMEILQSIADGREVMVDVKQARNPRQHRLFFKMLGLLVDNSDLFNTIQQALTAVKMGTGEADPVVDAETGEVFWVLRSINFESCDQARFNRIFDASLKLICTKWLVGTEENTLREELFRLVDGPERASLGRRVA